jgi:CRISPR-associated endonuclease/helicase Cas3
MDAKFFAHTAPATFGPSCNQEGWEPLIDHLHEVSSTAGTFAEVFGAGDWGRLAGLWHDLGKYSQEFQNYLRRAAGHSDPHGEDLASSGGRVDHSTAGSQHSAAQGQFGQLLAYVIAGHHAGLPDGVELRERLAKKIAVWDSFAPSQARSGRVPPLPLAPSRDASERGLGPFRLSLFMRMVFSSLVDADFLCTEAFMSPDKKALRPTWPGDILSRMEATLEAHLSQFGTPSTTVAKERENVRAACESAASLDTGFFDLTVPTGGGKTLSSLLFALRHARTHGLRRIVYAIPFTSIIEQNAGVFRAVFKQLSEEIGQDVVLEHHSNLHPDRENTRNRLSAENWDAPLVVTTNVQLFESLFACRTSSSRKVHRLAKSVIILDEAQSLPVGLLSPILSTLRCLALDYGSSVVLCTATQPALERRENFAPGIPSTVIRSIIPDRLALAQKLQRTRVTTLGPLDNAALKSLVVSEKQGALVVLNTTKAAREFHETLDPGLPRFHLSARMCPEHRTAVLNQVRALLNTGAPAFLVSTQLIEAGVDISFPAVFRAECGLDSLAQAAGRCNRNGELRNADGSPTLGRVYPFQHSGYEIPARLVDLRDAAATAAQVAALYPTDLLSVESIEHFFRLHIWSVGARTKNWDATEVMSCFQPGALSLGFRDAASRFHMIEQATQSLLIPWGEEGRQLCAELRNRHKLGIPPNRELFRAAQRFLVQVYEHEWKELLAHGRIETIHDGAIHILEHPENNYDEAFGLRPPNSPDSPEAFFC